MKNLLKKWFGVKTPNTTNKRTPHPFSKQVDTSDEPVIAPEYGILRDYILIEREENKLNWRISSKKNSTKKEDQILVEKSSTNIEFVRTILDDYKKKAGF
jgi:hypothetical protein